MYCRSSTGLRINASQISADGSPSPSVSPAVTKEGPRSAPFVSPAPPASHFPHFRGGRNDSPPTCFRSGGGTGSALFQRPESRDRRRGLARNCQSAAHVRVNRANEDVFTRSEGCRNREGDSGVARYLDLLPRAVARRKSVSDAVEIHDIEGSARCHCGSRSEGAALNRKGWASRAPCRIAGGTRTCRQTSHQDRNPQPSHIASVPSSITKSVRTVIIGQFAQAGTDSRIESAAQELTAKIGGINFEPGLLQHAVLDPEYVDPGDSEGVAGR